MGGSGRPPGSGLKWLLWGGAAVAVVTLAALAAVPWLVDTPRVQSLIATSAAQALGRPVKFRSVSVWALPRPAVRLGGLEVAEDPAFGREPFLRLDSGEMTLRLRPLLSGRFEFGELVLRKPLITLARRADGRWNVATLGGAREEARGPGRAPKAGGGSLTAAPPVTGVRIVDGVVTYVAHGAGGTAARYRLEDLDLTLKGTGTRVSFGAAARVMPGAIAVTVTEGVLDLGAHALPETPVAAKVALEAKDIAAVVRPYLPAGVGLGGGLRGTLGLSGSLGSLRASGPVEFSRLAITQIQAGCPEPRQRTLTLPSVTLTTAWEGTRLTARPLAATLGEGTVTAQLSVGFERGVRIDLRELAVRALPLETVLVDHLCQGYAVSGPLDLTGALAFSATDIPGTLTGPGTLRIGPGRVVGKQALALLDGVVRLGGGVSALLRGEAPRELFASPLEFDSIAGTYTLANGVATTRDLTYTSRTLRALVTGEYSLPTERLSLDVAVTTSGGQIRAKVTGPAASPSIRVASGPGAPEGKSVEQSLRDLLKRLR